MPSMIVRQAEGSNISKVTAVIYVAVIISILWLGRAPRSLSYDETITYWVSSGSLSELFGRAIYFQGQSPLFYFFIWLLQNMGLSGELALRTPSLVVMLGTVLLVYLLARSFLGTQIALYSTVLFTLTHESVYSASTARPYGMAIFFLLSSLYLLDHYCKTQKKSYCLFSIVTFVLAIYTHKIYAGAFLILMMMVAINGHFSWRFFLSYTSISCVLLAPLLYQVSILLNRVTEITEQGSPPLAFLAERLIPYEMISLVLLSMLIAIGLFKAKWEVALSNLYIHRKPLSLLACWHIAPALLIVLVALILNAQTLTALRYTLWAAPATAIILAFLISQTKSSFHSWLVLSATSCMWILLVYASAVPVEDWRGAIKHLNQGEHQQELLLFHSGLIESSNSGFLQNSDHFAYLTTPLTYYSYEREGMVLPKAILSSELDRYWNDQVLTSLENKARISLLINDAVHYQGKPVSEHYLDLLAQAGFSARRDSNFGFLRVIDLDRSHELTVKDTSRHNMERSMHNFQGQ